MAAEQPRASSWSDRRLVTSAIVVLLALAALLLGFLVEALRADRNSLGIVNAGQPIAISEIHTNHERLWLDLGGAAVLSGLAALLWLGWQYRAHARARRVSSESRLPPPVGVALWVIPGVNLVGPPLAMRELWRAGDTTDRPTRSVRTTPLLWLWWVMLLVALAITVRALAPVWGGHPTAADLMERDYWGVPAAGAGLVAAILAAVVVKWTDIRLMVKEFQSPDWRSWSRGGRAESRSA
jgi:Domain of unknown function (DUF4328)